MYRMKYLIVVLCVLGGFGGHLSAQVTARQVIATTGGLGQGSGNTTASFTVGQPVAGTLSGTFTMTQGFQQPDRRDIAVITSVEEAVEVSFRIFPNPATDFVNVRVSTEQAGALGLQAQVFSLQGQAVSGPVTLTNSAEQRISLEALTAGTYVLRFVSSTGEMVHQEPFIKR